MLAALRWYLVVQVLAVTTLPLAWRVFRWLPDRGYGVAKILGVLVVGTTLWVGTAAGVLRNDAGGAALALLAVAAAAVTIGTRGARDRRRWLRHGWSATGPIHVILTEALFLLAFAAWIGFRAHAPAADHTEQPMDLLLLSAVWNSPTFPPQDPWLAGYAISYYYLGHWLVSTIAHLAGQPPEIAYNVGQAGWFALLVVGCFSLGANLAACADRPRARRPDARAWLGGLLAVLAVALTSNLHGLGAGVSRLVSPGADASAANQGWWWWASTRVLHDVDLAGRPLELIEEFPAFSYLLGDNHAHVLAMPVSLLVLSLALNAFLLVRRMGHRLGKVSSWRADVRGGALAPLAVVTIVTAGALLGMNPWDVPTGWLVLVTAVIAACLEARVPGRHTLGLAAGVALAVPVGAALVGAPYLLAAQSQVQGIRPSLAFATSPGALLAVFGSFAPGLAALWWTGAGRPPVSWRRMASVALPVAALGAVVLALGLAWATATEAGEQWLVSHGGHPGTLLGLLRARPPFGWVTLALLVTLASVVHARLWTRDSGPAGDERRRSGRAPIGVERFVLLLAALGVTLLAAVELVHVADSFGTRTNTVFKFYYQAWLLLGLAAAHGTFVALRARGARVVAGVASLVLLLGGVSYLGAGVASRIAEGAREAPTLDALAYLVQADPDELAAIQWIRRHTTPAARVVQAEGTSYRADQSRIAVATGRATLLGWVDHERQWRGAAYAEQAEGRQAALAEIYAGTDGEALRHVLATWAVDFVYVGPHERALYAITPAAEDRLRQTMDLAFEAGSIRLYRRRG